MRGGATKAAMNGRFLFRASSKKIRACCAHAHAHGYAYETLVCLVPHPLTAITSDEMGRFGLTILYDVIEETAKIARLHDQSGLDSLVPFRTELTGMTELPTEFAVFGPTGFGTIVQFVPGSATKIAQAMRFCRVREGAFSSEVSIRFASETGRLFWTFSSDVTHIFAGITGPGLMVRVRVRTFSSHVTRILAPKTDPGTSCRF